MNAQRVASSPRRRGSFFPSFVPPLFLAYSTRLHAQSPLRLPLVILAGESSPDSCSIKSLHLTPCGVSFSTPERSGLQEQDNRALGIQPLALTPPNPASFIPKKVIPNWWPRIPLKSLHLKNRACHMQCGVIRCNTGISCAYAMSIRDKDARGYDPSQFASQKRRKTRMRRAIIERHIQAREFGA